MEGNARVGSGDGKTSNGEREQGENSNLNEQEAIASIEAVPRQSSARTPFTNLTQEEADLALARTLQEQERAYMMLSMNNNGSDYGSWEGSYLHDDENDFGNPDADPNVYEDEYDGSDADAFDVHAHSDREDNNPIIEFDPAVHSSDEAYARALQEAEEREIATRLLALAGINDGEVEDTEDHGGNSQDNWEEAEPDQLSYEELLALGEVVGSESRGLSADTIASLPSVNYEAGSSQNGNNDLCVICRLDYEDGETLTVLSCKHIYHSECINNWLKTKKVCPLCSAEVSISGHS